MEKLPLLHFNVLMKCCNLWLLFVVSATSFPSYCRACGPPVSCGGGRQFSYPFGGRNSGCGDPLLQLHCDDNNSDMPLLDINGAQYYVLEYSLTYNSSTLEGIEMKIIYKNLLGKKCDPHSSNSIQFRSGDQLRIVDEYMKIIILGQGCQDDFLKEALHFGCNASFSYSPFISWIEKCKSQVQVPVLKYLDPGPNMDSNIKEGFKVRWMPSRFCKQCMSKKGSCAYESNINSTRILCKPSDISDKSSIGVGLVFSIGGAVVVAVCVIVFFVYYVRRRKTETISGIRCSRTSKVERFLEEYIHEMPARYSFYQLQNITNNFSAKIGEGGFGVVYKGKLPKDTFVAVKVLDSSRHSENQFMNEVAAVGSIHHVNLVRLMGYCFEGSRSALVYEFMANGSLEKFIFSENGMKHILSWDQSYSIAVGAARGIAYLHQDCKSRIIHFDIKPHNILLDEDFTPKIADFGLAKICGRGEDHISLTATRGTPGYVAPEVWSRTLGPVTDKSDVYSFGMLLLEMVGARRNIDVRMSRSSQLYFPEWVFKLLQSGQLETMLKGRGRGEIGCEEEEKGKRLTKVGLWCIQYNSRDRPSMNKVVQMLEGNGEDVSDPPMPFNSSNTPTLLHKDIVSESSSS